MLHTIENIFLPNGGDPLTPCLTYISYFKPPLGLEYCFPLSLPFTKKCCILCKCVYYLVSL